MLFIHSLITDIEDGTKTQTRRLAKPYRSELNEGDIFDPEAKVIRYLGRQRFACGKPYSVQPGRRKRCSIGKDGKPLKIVITDIRSEDIRRISEADVKAEGSRFDNQKAYHVWWAQHYDYSAYKLLRYVGLTYDEWPGWLAARPAVFYAAWVLTFEVYKG